MLDAAALAARFEALGDHASFISSLRQLNGFFAVVQTGEGTCRLAVDRIRSIPLFYAAREGEFRASDDCYWVDEQLGDQSRNELAAAEFLHLGYVTGSDTTSAVVKQCRAGEVIVAYVDGQGAIGVEPSRYYYYKHLPPDVEDNAGLTRRFEEVLDRVFLCFDCSRGGRTIAIPLSGGYDSRLIALMLRKLGYKKVTTFCYGPEDTWEATISARVAADLDFSWQFIPYNHAKWAAWYHTPEQRNFQRYHDSLSGVPNIQDWPAIWELRRQEILPPDCIVVPGHTGDIIAGGRSNPLPEFYVPGPADAAALAEKIVGLHYGLWGTRLEEDPLYPLRQCARNTVDEILSFGAEVPPASSRPGSGRTANRGSLSIRCEFMIFGAWLGGYRCGMPSSWIFGACPCGCGEESTGTTALWAISHQQVTGKPSPDNRKRSLTRGLWFRLRSSAGCIASCMPCGCCTCNRRNVRRNRPMRRATPGLTPA